MDHQIVTAALEQVKAVASDPETLRFVAAWGVPILAVLGAASVLWRTFGFAFRAAWGGTKLAWWTTKSVARVGWWAVRPRSRGTDQLSPLGQMIATALEMATEIRAELGDWCVWSGNVRYFPDNKVNRFKVAANGSEQWAEPLLSKRENKTLRRLGDAAYTRVSAADKDRRRQELRGSIIEALYPDQGHATEHPKENRKYVENCGCVTCQLFRASKEFREWTNRPLGTAAAAAVMGVPATDLKSSK